jgi:hypothetical protein
MLKTVNIGNKDYVLKSSAYTIFAYKNETGRDLLVDLNSINEKYIKISKLTEEEQNSAWMNEVTGIIENTLKIAHIMIRENDKTFKEYNEWLKDIDELLENPNWIMEVLEVGIAPFRGNIQRIQQ